jgi:anti-sigma factor RsiW
MKHHMNDEGLALYLRGDLSGTDYRAVKQHVDACPDCQCTLNDLSRSHELLVGAFDEPTTAELTAVRSAVAARIQTRTRGPAWRIWAFAAPAVVAVMLVLANLSTQTQPPPKPPVAPAVPPAVVRISPPPVVARAARPRRVVPGARSVTLLTRAERPDLLKINTSDPNIVILWQLNENERADTP